MEYIILTIIFFILGAWLASKITFFPKDSKRGKWLQNNEIAKWLKKTFTDKQMEEIEKDETKHIFS